MKYFLVFLLLAGVLTGTSMTVAEVVEAHTRTVRIKVDRKGFSPASIKVESGHQVKLVFNRADAGNCGDTVVFPQLNIRKSLPVGKNVTVSLKPEQAGELTFTCGMGMYKGSIVVGQ